MRRDIVTSAIALALFTVLLGVIYPLVVTGIGQLAFSGKANGSQIHLDGKLVGSGLIGQQFADVTIKNGKPEEEEGKPVTSPDPRYFQSRPSATAPSYNGAGSSFSNLGPDNRATKEAIAKNVTTYLSLEQPYTPGLDAAGVPVDAGDSSASGLDPDISQANARIQANRIAAVRRLAKMTVLRLISMYTTQRTLGIFGEPGVNVLELNLALNRLSGGR